MKLKQKGFSALVPLVFVAIAAAVGFSAHYFTKKDDGPIEEAMEEYIESETGHNIDLTPGSKENKDA